MVKCSFCKEEVKPGTGVKFVKNDGKIFNFCSKKCDKNMLKLGRKGKYQKWVTKKKKVTKK
jgi:large subunit ribosomal protein L24e